MIFLIIGLFKWKFLLIFVSVNFSPALMFPVFSAGCEFSNCAARLR